MCRLTADLCRIYQLLRAFSARMIVGNEAIFNRARDHAIGILHLEEWLGVAIEKDFQQWIMNEHAWLLPHLRNIYYSHISLGICFLIYIYTYLPHNLSTHSTNYCHGQCDRLCHRHDLSMLPSETTATRIWICRYPSRKDGRRQCVEQQ